MTASHHPAPPAAAAGDRPGRAGMAGVVTVWLLPTAAVPAAAVAAAAGLLDGPERARAAAFRRAEDARDYILAHALLRRALSAAAAGAAPEGWRFVAGRGGKPELAGPGPAFNLSHTRGLVAAAVGTGAGIGVDVEAAGTGRPEELAATVLTAAEQADLAGCPAAGRRRRFLRYWTLKEALLKATGDALAVDPAGFGMRLDPPALIPGGAYPPDPAAWAFAEYPLPEGLAAAAVPAGSSVAWRTGWPG